MWVVIYYKQLKMMMLKLRQTLLQRQQSHAGLAALLLQNAPNPRLSARAAMQGQPSQALRNFALFNSGQASSQRQQYAGAAESGGQRTQEDIVRSIEMYKTNIRNKTQQGYALSKAISEQVPQDKHVKLQRYEIFIDKMQRLYKSEIRFQQKQKKKFEVQRNSILYSMTPLKDIFRSYNELTNRGFNSEATVETLKNAFNAIRARGFKGRPHGDYSVSELDQSVRMQKLVDDLKFGLRADQFFSPHHLAQANLSLGDLGYKNADLIPRVFEKLNNLLDERQLGVNNEQRELNFQDAVFGDAQGFISRHYVFKGFQNSDEFNEYLKILMDWETDTSRADSAAAEVGLSDQAADIQRSMADIINAAVQVKELQKDYQASIDNLRQQYFKMSEATDKHQFLQENQYIKYDLFELQELLVQGGYIDPKEATTMAFLSNEPFDQRMQRAADVFYDYVLNYAPELLSPQHTLFYNHAQKALQKDSSLSSTFLQGENQNLISLKTLSQTLVGLSEQALSFRREVNGRDYLNKFYDQYLHPAEQRLLNHEPRGLEKIKSEIIMMERSYLKPWQLFKENALRIVPRLATLVEEDKDNLEGQLYALTALAACRVEEPALREEIINNSLKALNLQQLSPSSIISGLRGLAEGPSVSDKGRSLASSLAEKLDLQGKSLTFSEYLDTIWSLAALQLYDCKAFGQSLNYFNSLNFERIDNELKFGEYQKLLDVYNALRFEAPKRYLITNQGLREALQGSEMYLGVRYQENATMYDPFKQRVVQALSKGLTNASVEHQVINENQLFEAQVLETDVLNKEKYPYQPDILMGYKGQKVGVFVLPETLSTRDTHQADGAIKFRMRLIESAHQGKFKATAIAVDEVVNYDIEKLMINVNKDFNLTHALDRQIKSPSTRVFGEPDFSAFSDFGGRLIGNAVDFIEKQIADQDRDVAKVDAFVKKLYQILQIKQSTQVKFEPLQRQAGFDEIRFQMMKLSLLYDSLSKECKGFVDRHTPDSFKALLKKTLSTLPKEDSSATVHPFLNSSWLGTRQAVELPVSAITSRKSIVPEIINTKFMWVEDYFHYDDWRAKQKQVFDNFNLLVVPPSVDAQKFFYDKDLHNRRVPQGVFPYPNHKRQLMLPSSNQTVVELLKSKHNDEFILYEKEPFKMMVINELKKSETLASIDEETSMITNLQNLKQGLKSDYSDKDILNIILLNLNFTEQLIEEHLGLSQSGSAGAAKQLNKAKLLSRDAEKFRNFIHSQYHSKDREDPFTHFYLKESRTQEHLNKLIEDENQIQNQVYENAADSEVHEEGQQRKQALKEKIENVLLAEEMKNEDLLDLSSSLKTNVRVKYDLRTLVRSEFIYDVDPELDEKSSGLSHEAYLEQFRKRAEAKLIKTKIIYKLYNREESAQGGAAPLDLTKNEQLYLNKWVSDIKNGKDRNLMNLRDSMVPQIPTKLTVGDLDAKTLYALNSVSKVSIEREKHGQFSVSDLVVELSHFLDEDVVNKVETEIFSDKLRKEWGLSKDFKAVETRNKEISTVLNQLEEVAWRSAGMLTDQDFENLKKMISIKRNKDYFDKQFYANDMTSFRNYFEAVNNYDDRLALIERWLIRKEDEYKARVVLPPANLAKADQEIYEKLDRPMRKARESLAARLLIADEYGNAIDKKYSDLTSRELHILTENLCLRLYLFNYQYPAFVPQVVRAMIEHPNLLKSDRDQLELYSRMFELDWRGDRSYDNKQEFMATHPIYVEGTNLKSFGELTNEVVKDKLQRACAPYVEEAARRLINQSQ